MKKEIKWITIEDENFIHTFPETDCLPHGTPINGNEYELSSVCKCKPQVLMGDSERLFKKPLIHHNCFIHQEIVKIAMDRLK